MLSDDQRRRESEEAQVFALLRQLDHPVPRVNAETIAARAHGAAPEIRWQRWAAGIFLVAGLAGAAYAMPGSRVPAWVRALSEWIGGQPERSVRDGAPVRSPAQASVAGIAVPAGAKLVIVFTTPDPKSEARIALTDGTDVVVRAPEGAATFMSDLDRIVIDNRGPASAFEIDIPRSAPRVEVRVNLDRLYLKEGERATPSSPLSGVYATPLAARK